MVSVTETGNPLSRQFAAKKPFFQKGEYVFYTQQDASLSAMAQELLSLDTVAHVRLSPLFITITLVDESLWSTQAPIIEQCIQKHLAQGTVITQDLNKENQQFVAMTYTPNPLSRQFSTGIPFFNSGSYTFYTQDATSISPLAQELLSMDDVHHVLITPLFVTVTLHKEELWDTSAQTIIHTINRRINSGQPIVDTTTPQPRPTHSTASIMDEVEDLMQRHIEPTVASHGGHIRLVKIEDDIVYIELQGSCDGCPSAVVTLKNGIENLLCFYLPSIKEVKAINLEN